MTLYRSQAARDVAETPDYAAYIEESAIRHAAYYAERGMLSDAERMLNRGIGEALAGNDGA